MNSIVHNYSIDISLQDPYEELLASKQRAIDHQAAELEDLNQRLASIRFAIAEVQKERKLVGQNLISSNPRSVKSG
jgi:hypothetical protein